MGEFVNLLRRAVVVVGILCLLPVDFAEARYYDAKTGRFLNEDPRDGFLSRPQTKNRYIYVENNPIILVDPFGELSKLDPRRVFVGKALETEFETRFPGEFSKKEKERAISHFNDALEPADLNDLQSNDEQIKFKKFIEVFKRAAENVEKGKNEEDKKILTKIKNQLTKICPL